MDKPVFYPRSIQSRLEEALEDSPVVLIYGPRQCGKTTLAQITCAPAYQKLKWGNDTSVVWGADTRIRWRFSQPYTYINFDDQVPRESALTDPIGFIADLPDFVILDEIQRVPNLFEVIKTEVDSRRVPGRFILTGSTNVLLVPKLSESLVGRMQIVRLHPLAQYEMTPQLADSPQGSEFLNTLFGDGFTTRHHDRLGIQLAEKIVAGGFPSALTRPTTSRRFEWYRNSYIEPLIQRDVQDMTRIRSFNVLPQLLGLAALKLHISITLQI